MIKYIKVDWPEYQKFEEHERINECYTCKVYGDDDIFSLMVPEDLYEEVVNEFPKEVETNLGTIKFEEYYAYVANQYFWYAPYPNKGDILLIYNKNTKNYKIVTCIANAEGFPILTDDKGVAIGIFDELIGSYKP